MESQKDDQGTTDIATQCLDAFVGEQLYQQSQRKSSFEQEISSIPAEEWNKSLYSQNLPTQWIQTPSGASRSPAASAEQNIFSYSVPPIEFHVSGGNNLFPNQFQTESFVIPPPPQFIPSNTVIIPQVSGSKANLGGVGSEFSDHFVHPHPPTTTTNLFYKEPQTIPFMAPPTNFSSIAPGIDTPDGYFIPHAYNPDPYPDPIHIPTGSSVIDTDSVVGDFGRTYHGYKEGKYLLPNDAAEQDRLDFQYAGVSVLLAGRLFFAPIVNPKYAIDIATGTGIWAIEFAEMFPNCQVIGTDLSSIQPTNPPSNVTFLKDDAESDWVFPYKFDYVHLRIIFTCFNDHKRMMQEAFKSMHSGGWMEYQDPDASCVGCVDNETPDYFAFQRVISAARIGAKLLVGRDIALTRKYKGWMEEVGFVNVHEHKVRIPLSPWPTDPREKLGGSYMQRNYLDGALMALWKMVRASGMSEVETKCLFTDAKAELLDTSKRLYTVLYVVYGQKP